MCVTRWERASDQLYIYIKKWGFNFASGCVAAAVAYRLRRGGCGGRGGPRRHQRVVAAVRLGGYRA
jgi:hypothetical protein